MAVLWPGKKTCLSWEDSSRNSSIKVVGRLGFRLAARGDRFLGGGSCIFSSSTSSSSRKCGCWFICKWVPPCGASFWKTKEYRLSKIRQPTRLHTRTENEHLRPGLQRIVVEFLDLFLDLILFLF